MDKIEFLQEKYDSNKNDMSKEELLEFNEHLFKCFFSDKEANDDIFWAYSEITDRVIEDLKEKNAQLINVRRLENKGDRGYINKLELEIELNRVTEDNERLEKDLVKERSLSNQLSLQAGSHERGIIFFQKAIKEQRDIVIDEVIERLDKEIMYYNIFETKTAREFIHLKNKIKEMGNK